MYPGFLPSAAVRALLGLCIPCAAAMATDAAPDELDTVYVYATAIEEDPQKIASSFSVLEGEALFEHTRATLGETLGGLPGVHADTFGGGSARPVIRGHGAPRVTVLSDSAGLLDASDISPDHAVTAEPMLVERIEVLRGPATLLYGSGAIGGVINLLDEKVPTAMPQDGLAGSVGVRGGTAARERAVAAGVTAQAAPGLALRLEGTTRRAADYRVSGVATRRVEGTWAESGSATAGASWIRDNGYLGLAYTYRNDDYGVPGHSHDYESCHPHGASLHCGGHGPEEPGHDDDHDHDHEHGHGEAPRVALRSERLDLRGEFRAPFALAERIRLRASYSDYRHDELEADEIGTTFRNAGLEARLEIQHVTLGGLRGVVGVQHSDTRSRASGTEAFLPTVDSRATGLFIIEHLELDTNLHLELGARHEWLRHHPVDDPRGRSAFSRSTSSFSAAMVWEPVADHYLTVSAARFGRLPHPQELYARGVHLATNTYECGLLPSAQTCGGAAGDAPLRREASRNIELGWRHTAGSLTFSVNAFDNRVDHYTYARTLDQFEDFRLVRYSQRDARFRGGEVEVTWQFAPAFSATLFGDVVRARFTGGEPLPRIPPARHGARLQGGIGEFGAEVEFHRVSRQRRIAGFETATPGHDMLNVTLRQRLSGTGLHWYLRGSNLLDETAWNHSSFLANTVPLRGRSVDFGLNLDF